MSGSDWYISDEPGRALVALARGVEPRADLLFRPEIAHLAYRHGLIVPAARTLGPSSPRGRYLTAVAARMAARHACIDRHLRRILTELVERGIRVAVVKGPAVATAYQDPSIRTYTDVDLVVPPEDLELALKAFAGYEGIGAIPARVPAAEKRDIVVRDPTGVQFTVDLHWDLFSFHQLGGSAKGAIEQTWQEATFEPDHHLGPLWELPTEAVVSFLGMHACLDHRFRLILFRDLAELASRGLDWQELVDFSERYGLAGFEYLVWLIATEITGATTPGWFLERLRRGSWAERAAEHYLKKVDIVRFDGHRVHPLNLAMTQIHDDRRQRRRLLVRAPRAYPRWRRRVGGDLVGEHPSVDVLVTSNARRGAEVFGRHLTDSLVLRGWDANLVSLRGGDVPGVGATPVMDEPIDLGRLRPKVVRALRRRFRTYRPSVVFVNGGATLRYAVAAAMTVLPRPRLVYGSIGEPNFWLRGRTHWWWQRLLIAACHRVTAVSHCTGRALEEFRLAPKEKISVVHLGVDESWFAVPNGQESQGPMRVLFAGRLSFEKDPLTAVKAVAALGDDATLRMAGDGPLRTKAEQAAPSNVKVVGAVADLQSEMEWSDVLLLTSLTEGLPGVAVEAAAAGRPVVAANVGGTAEVVVDGETGFLVEPGDLDGFVSALRTLTDDRELRLKLGENARRRARELFRLEDTVDSYETIFRKVTAR